MSRLPVKLSHSHHVTRASLVTSKHTTKPLLLLERQCSETVLSIDGKIIASKQTRTYGVGEG